ncbi:hypothetical protein KVR01_004980 [Diaporthe batatas]|uniref:uncharacterized protein n=1 Tax=Diaporthe batatas TaxID=748121 RepID=UPI001D04DB60|nr:uncharacterized protein KVR01_004980 [Diaporthe batatas]KAG8164705.1 hypothetical protein KVR01_004980 [Diaporthe batatas]
MYRERNPDILAPAASQSIKVVHIPSVSLESYQTPHPGDLRQLSNTHLSRTSSASSLTRPCAPSCLRYRSLAFPFILSLLQICQNDQRMLQPQPSDRHSSLVQLQPPRHCASLRLCRPLATATRSTLATHLQLSFNYEGSGEIFIPDFVTSGDLVKSDREAKSNLYEVEKSAHNVPRAKVNEGASRAAEVFVYAWRSEKLLGKWFVGRVEDLGIEGLKSDPLAILRRDTWAAKKAASSALQARKLNRQIA